MPYSGRALFYRLTILGGFAVLVGPVQGASHGVHALHAQQLHSSQTSDLPTLHEPAPSHVPTLSNTALIHLWEKNQYSPILRDPGIERQLSIAVSAARDINPTRFDLNHPLLGHMLRDTNFFNSVLNAYMTNPARFTLYHHRFIPLLRGYAMNMVIPTVPTPQLPTPEVSPGQISNPGSTTVTSVPEGINNGTGPSTGATQIIAPAAVPEPSGIILLFLGISFVAIRYQIHRRRALVSC